MSMDDATSAQCPVCDSLVELHEPGGSYKVIDGLPNHPACALKAYTEEVVAILTAGPEATRDIAPQYRTDDDWPISDEEKGDLEDALDNDVPAKTFAMELVNKDIARWERASDPYPQREYPEVAMN